MLQRVGEFFYDITISAIAGAVAAFAIIGFLTWYVAVTGG